MTQRGNSGQTVVIAVIILLVAVCVVAWVGWTVAYDVSTYQITGTVEDKEIVPSGNKDDPMSYVVWLTDGTKLEVKSNLWHNNNEDDIWRRIDVNGTYTFTCWGYQLDVPALGIYWYPNIVGVAVGE